MKLNPPASSSDLEVARAIARRLDHRPRGTEPGPDPTPPPAPVAPPPAVARPARRPAPRRPSPPPEPVEPPSEAEQELTDPNLELEADMPELAASELEPEPPELAVPEPEPPELSEPDPEPEPPELSEPDPEPEPPELEPDVPELAEPEFEPELKAPDLEPELPPSDTPEPPDLPGLEPSSGPEAPPEPLFEPDMPGLSDEPSLSEEELAPPPAYGADTGEFEPGAPDVPGVEESMLEQLPPGGYGPAATSIEEPTFSEDDFSDEGDALAELAAPPAASELDGMEPPPGGVSPEDLLSDEPAAPGWSDPAALEAEMVGGEEEPQPEPEAPVAPPSPWDEVADSCLALAPANGAMLVDPAGQVLTARGDWPEPGPEAIAGRLVSMMEKKLRDAPTRSVSAPLAGQHLTAWRVPSAEGYLTVVFMADAPLKADIRPAIDTVVQAADS